MDARDLARLGIALNLAPVVDVERAENRQLAERTFGEPDDVTTLGDLPGSLAARRTRHRRALKHFPGLGASARIHRVEIHTSSPRTTRGSGRSTGSRFAR